jgi:WD40 repeat protein/serine/threonine protein kinase
MAESSNRPKDLFLNALDLPSPVERAAFLAQECGSDEALRRQIEAMLQAHATPDSFLEKPAVELGATVDAVPVPEKDRAAGAKPSAEGPRTRVGPYKLLQKLGEGGMGTVFLAEQQEPVRRMIALKIIKQGMDSAQIVARFESERQALALMDHPNIARVLDAGTTDSGRPYFVMELIKGIPITKFCDQEHLTPRERLELFIPVCQAVQHAHQKGIIHRDLKPSNVLITLYDGKPIPKVIDFGVAKATSQKLTERTLFTEVGSMVGTLEYMAPEQAELNNLDIDTRADIYALGVMMYELLTGSPPFSAKELRSAAFTEMLRIIREVEPPRPSTKLSSSLDLPAIASHRKLEPSNLTRQVQGDLDWIVMKCLEKERGRRYETANAVAQDLQRYLTDEPVLAGPPSASYRLRKFVKRNRGTVTASAIVLASLLAGIIGTSWGWIEAIQNAGLAEKRRGEAKKLADANKLLADKEGKARLDADQRREQAEALALRVQVEHYFSKAEDRSDLALVGMASLLPNAARLKDQSLVNSLRLYVGAWGGRTARLSTICAHQDKVSAVALSGDGKTVLMAGDDKVTRLWETATGKPIGPPLQQQDRVWAVALGIDGKMALTAGSDDNTARLWETATGTPIGPPLQHEGIVGAVALSADGKMAITGSRDKTARLWETATGTPIGPPLKHQDEVVGVYLSADGKTALTVSFHLVILAQDPPKWRLWDTMTGKPIGPPLPQAFYASMVLSADGKTALTGSYDKTARLWDATTGKPIGPPLQHQDAVVAVALSADGKTALTGSDDRTARLWEMATGKPIGPPLQHQDRVQTVALSADGKTALTGSWDRTARLWETATGKPIGPPLQHKAAVVMVAMSANGKTALTKSGDRTVRLWEIASGKRIGPPLHHQSNVVAVALSADSKTALLGSRDWSARLWETATGKPIGPPFQHNFQHNGQVRAVALSADGKMALTAGREDTSARLWETATGNPIGLPLQHPRAAIRNVALSADGKTALTASHDGMARLWEATGKPIGPPLEHQVQFFALSADGTTALTAGSQENTVRMWEMATGKPIGPPLQHQGQVLAAVLSADGKTALTGSGNTARLWETATGKLIGPALQHQGEVHSVTLSADGKMALTGSHDNTAQLWEAATGKPIGPPLLHQDPVYAVALSADGKTALTGSSDKTARLWETATGKLIGPPLLHQDPVHAVALSADGKTAVTTSRDEAPTGSRDETARLWHVPQPMRGDPERIMLWTQVITGLEVDELTAVRFLDAATWQQRRQRLQELGGPPTP